MTNKLRDSIMIINRDFLAKKEAEAEREQEKNTMDRKEKHKFIAQADYGQGWEDMREFDNTEDASCYLRICQQPPRYRIKVVNE